MSKHSLIDLTDRARIEEGSTSIAALGAVATREQIAQNAIKASFRMGREKRGVIRVAVSFTYSLVGLLATKVAPNKSGANTALELHARGKDRVWRRFEGRLTEFMMAGVSSAVAYFERERKTEPYDALAKYKDFLLARVAKSETYAELAQSIEFRNDGTTGDNERRLWNYLEEFDSEKGLPTDVLIIAMSGSLTSNEVANLLTMTEAEREQIAEKVLADSNNNHEIAAESGN